MVCGTLEVESKIRAPERCIQDVNLLGDVLVLDTSGSLRSGGDNLSGQHTYRERPRTLVLRLGVDVHQCMD